jgi:hypothetical protein
MHNPFYELVLVSVGLRRLVEDSNCALAAIDGDVRAIRNLVECGRQLNCW